MDIGSKLEKDGFAFFKKLDPGLSLEEVSVRLGIVWSGGGDAKAHCITPRDTNKATPNTYSGNYGLRAFPLHTDLAHWRQPPRYLVLRCKAGTEFVATLLLDGHQVIGHERKKLLGRALILPRRPVQGNLPLLTLYRKISGTLGILRWDELFIRPASKQGELGFDLIRDAISRSSPMPVNLSDPGDTLIVDNWRMLHGRSSVPRGSEERVIERIYLEEIY